MADVPGGPDLGAVGNAARVSKQSVAQRKELQSFTVRKGDNGGVIVSETYETKAPEGRRPASFMGGGGDYKENPFSPDDGAEATTHVTGLLSQMGVSTTPEPGESSGAPTRPPMMAPRPVAPPPRPAVTVARGPNATAVRGPAATGVFKRPDILGGNSGL